MSDRTTMPMRRRKPSEGKSGETVYSRKSHRVGKRATTIEFDEETFHQIGAIALRRQISFAHVARELIEWGLMALETE